MAVRPYDNTKTLIYIGAVNKPWANTDTTLASELKNGDTTVTLTSGANWKTDTYARLGICNLLAHGYNKASYTQPISSISGNTITLSSAWSGGTFSSGTKVAEFRSGNSYYYPLYISGSAQKPTTWTSYAIDINGADIRYSCQYVSISTIGYGHNYSLRNIRFTCTSSYQSPYYKFKNQSVFNVSKYGLVNGYTYFDQFCKVRYIKDTCNGSNKNVGNHLCEIKVFNDVGENIAWGKSLKYGSTIFNNSVATDGTVNNAYIQYGSNKQSVILDLGFVENISKIIIWHYYADGRTYNDNVVEISSDSTIWHTVYKGKKAETSSGNEILINPLMLSVYENGDVYAKDFIEW